ncbi:rhodanese-like domain-containing protein [Anoxynatronum sibiricum]|uniref:thiosulfate sulfurtransferase n=1 Tax=Anoxynatronum sibiricum TaxID=210623 RepID=A0ABU9VTI1_9CLOT
MNSKIKILLALMLASVLFFSGCGGNDPVEPEQETQPESAPSENVEAAEVSSLTTEEVQAIVEADDWVLVDTRLNDAYIGWALEGVSRGGHLPGAVDFSANWLVTDHPELDAALEKALDEKGITPDKNILLYDANGTDAQAVKGYLEGKGYENLFLYDVKEWADDQGLPMERYANYHLVVPAYVVNEIIEGRKPETFENAGEIKIVEASWGEEETSYANGHVPGSFHINTDLVEPPPDWMLADAETLTDFALEYGFTVDDTVIVTSEYQMAAYRVAVVLRYMGVQDVRVLNGGLGAWIAAGYEVETDRHDPVPVTDFGAVIPANPELIVTIDELKNALATDDQFVLVDNRTWEEHIGETSGYSYHDKAGRIPGAVFGHAGYDDANSLQHFQNVDMTMRNGDEIKALWTGEGINLNKHLSFMCGSGWRAAEVLYYAQVMGLENTSLYSDGWIGWSNDPSNPVETGIPQ